MRTTFLMLALASCFTGCASVQMQRDALTQAKPCCNSYSDLPIEQFPPVGEELEITERTPVFDFLTGRSRFRAFELPALDEAAARLSVTALGQATGVYSGGKSWQPYFHPAVTFLNAEKAMISTYTEDNPAAPPDTCGALFGCGVAILMMKIPQDAKYVVIHTPFEKVGETKIEQLSGGLIEHTILIGNVPMTTYGMPTHRTIGMSTGVIAVRIEK